MTKLTRKYQDALLILAMAAFVGFLIFAYARTTSVLIRNFQKAISAEPTGQSRSQFDLAGAKKVLTERGLLR